MKSGTTSTNQISIEDLIKQYQRYITKVASTLTTDDYIKEELCAEGTIGLWKAYSNFNEAEGNLHSYLINYIKGYMLNWLTNNSRTIKVPANVVHHINRTEGLEFTSTLSLDMKIGDEDSSTLSEMVEDHFEDKSLDDSSQLKLDLLRQYLPNLSIRYQTIIKMVYFEEKSLTEIGKHFNVSLENIRQQHQLALDKLKSFYKIQPTKPKATKGYSFNKQRNKWIASQVKEGKRIQIGAYSTEEEAAAAIHKFRTKQ